ncbi:hypothetical protein ARMA_0220 [Ardenticatena maritima]|uniref:Uncharacterized protein n=1 Tax=Ardenticatena maritima TaxID=872965 RepID=A0A0M9UBI8_9CHLR|nr:hypothetical protein ARMA_0220 [Ardenticatena maritima]
MNQRIGFLIVGFTRFAFIMRLAPYEPNYKPPTNNESFSKQTS